VHAPGDADRSQQHLDATAERPLAVSAWIEQTDGDVRVLIERQKGSIVSVGVDVIEEEPDTNAAVGGRDDLMGEKAPRQILVPDVILQIQAASRRALRARIAKASRLPSTRMTPLWSGRCDQRCHETVERRSVVRDRKGEGRLALRPFRETAVAIEGQDRSERESHPCDENGQDQLPVI
jgi:hypothetical protein